MADERAPRTPCRSRSVTVTRHVGVALPRAVDERVRARHVGRHGQLEDGHRPRRGEAAGDRPADPRERDGLDLAAATGAGGADAGVAAPRRPGALDVLGDDASLGARCRSRSPGSMPRSRAIRRARGEALMRPRRRRGARRSTGSARNLGLRPSSSRLGAAPRRALGQFGRHVRTGSRPHRPAHRSPRRSAPTGTSPSWTAILSRTPLASASTSWVTLSVSTS